MTTQRCSPTVVLILLGAAAAAMLAMVVALGVTKLGNGGSGGGDSSSASSQADDFGKGGGGGSSGLVLTSAPTAEPTVTPGNPTRSPTFPPPPTTNANVGVASDNTRPAPGPVPAPAPTQPVTLTYTPGDLSVEYEGLRLSRGLVATIVAESDAPVQYANGDESTDDFEQDPAGGATFPRPDGGWIYVVDFDRGNDRGGVGALTFNAEGRVTDYRVVLEDTNDNRHGTSTPWGTYLSSENESDGDGSIYEVDPTGLTKGTRTLLGSVAGRSAWTGVAIDNRRSNAPVFYVSSNQDEEGFVFRYRPSQDAINAHLFSEPAFHLLQDDPDPTVEYLVLVPTPDDPSRGVFTWIDDDDLGRDSAAEYFAAVSSLDAYDGVLYMTSEERQELFALDLDNEEYGSESTDVGDFEGDPACVVHILSGHESRRRRRRRAQAQKQKQQEQRRRQVRNEPRQLHAGHAHGGAYGSAGVLPADLPSLYFCEDGNDNEKSGVFARNEDGRYVAILEDEDRRGDVSALAFSPSLRQMFVATKSTGEVFMVEREDGQSFDAPVLAAVYIEE
eukprot:CAMPEP_0181071806 /NCGR_PEP_ID=MMETSP1070-20121207/28241_1 /TAXON_ID=265543 /ORGANISM="Minutocellus polymorphus, Strain NH13" /LENGTH=557 /DNA_ID=CAMNT_0023152833 /DNA_START=289 /DNA_END=1962 /DNA_ORIENTATION=+